MIVRLASIATSLALGATVAAALYWLFLITPESNAVMLTASAALVIAIVAASGITIGTALLMAQDTPLKSSLRSTVRNLHWVMVAAIPTLIVWLLMARADAWLAGHAGEMHAWFIASLGWADVTWLLRAETWLSRWIRWVVAPVASLCLLVALLQTGVAALRSTEWIRRAWHWRTLAFATLVMFLLLAWPWQLTMWRPRLPATWVEPVVAALRLAAVFGLGLLGSTLVIWIAATGGRRRGARGDHGA